VIVIDASSIAKYVLKEDGWDKVEIELREESLTIDQALKEVSNAIWKNAIILRNISIDDAIKRYQILIKMVKEGILTVENESKYIDKAFNLALKEQVTVYDALYMVQALENKATLVTSDHNQAQIAKTLGLTVRFIP